MEEVYFPTPIPDVDTERVIDELECSLRIKETQQKLDAKIATLLQCKANAIATEAQVVALEFSRKAVEVQSAHDRAVSTLQFDITKSNVDLHKWRQTTALLRVKLSSALEDVDNSKELIQILKQQCQTEASAREQLQEHVTHLRQHIVKLQDVIKEIHNQRRDLKSQLQDAHSAAEEDAAQLAQLQDTLKMSSNQAKQELSVAQSTIMQLQQQLETVKERAALAEQTAYAAKERANLAESTLKQREALVNDRAQLHSEKESFSHAAELQREKEARHAAEARTKQLEKDFARLMRQSEAKDRRIVELEDALRRQEGATPARITQEAMETVGALVGQLHGAGYGFGGMGDDDEDVSPLLKPTLAVRGGRAQKAAAPVAKAASPAKKGKSKKNAKEDEDWQMEEEKPKPAAAKPRRSSKRSQDDSIAEQEEKPKQKKLADIDQEEEADEEVMPMKRRRGSQRRTTNQPAAANDDEEEEVLAAKKPKKTASNKAAKPAAPVDNEQQDKDAAPSHGNGLLGRKLTTNDAAPKPLGSLSQNTVQAANQHLKPTVPAKPHAQKSILAGAPGIGGGGMPGGKRMLLGVSTGAQHPGRPGPALPALALLNRNGAGFQPPRLTGKPQQQQQQ